MESNGLQEVEARLAQWAYYRITLLDGAIGWPSKNLIISLSEGRGARYPTTGVCLILKFDHSQQTDTWLKSLGKEYPHLQDAITIYYCCKLSTGKVAQILGISKRTLLQRVHDAKLWLGGTLQAYNDAQTIQEQQATCKELPSYRRWL